MKRKLNPNYPSTGVMLLVLGAGFGLLAVGISNISVVRDGLATGQVYTALVVFGDSTMVYRSNSPVEYWTMLGIASVACLGGICLGILMPILNIMAYIKKLARQKKERGKQ